jgi:methylenetetrahydrofolate reductase (NADPH)
MDIVQHIEERHGIIGLAHLTCVLHTKDELKGIIENIKSRGIKNILALRGDPPLDQPDWTPGADNFSFSSDLVGFIRREFGDHFGIAVAGFPEGHLMCKDRDKDAQYLKKKIDAGADVVITQIYFDNKDYFDYVGRLRKIGVHAPVLPGILPITDYEKLKRFCSLCGATITDEVKGIFEPIADDPDAMYKAGINFAVRQCQQLLASGAPGLHFYSLNKLSPTDKILAAIGSINR